MSRVSRATAVVIAGLAVSAAVALAVLVPAQGKPVRTAAGPPLAPLAPPVATTAAPAVPAPTLIATLTRPADYRSAPGGPVAGHLPANNPFGTPEVLAVIGRAGADWSWLRVELPVRPNGSTGWIQASDATLTQTSYRVEVDVAARRLTVTKAGRVVLTTPVAVGRPTTPTPPDQTYLWELIQPDHPDGPYGPYIFGLAEFSDSYSVFNGGDAQIGIHGQDEPWSIGSAASHGCVRTPNDVITRLAGLLPLGTPVSIS